MVVVCCALLVAAVMGTRSVPTYESKLTLQLLPYKPSVFDRAVDAGKVALYEGYIQSQAVFIRSPILIDRVLSQAEDGAGDAGSPLASWSSREFIESIRVEHPEDTQLIHIYFQDSDPATTKVAVNLIGSEYVRMHESNLSGIDDERLAKITKRINKLSQQRDQLRASILALSPDTNIAELTARLDVQTRFISTIERDLVTVRSNLATAEIFIARAGGGGVADQTENPSAVDTMDDPIIRRYKILLAETEDRLAVLSDHIGTNHIYYRNSERLIAQLKRNIADRVKTLESAGGDSTGPDGMSGSLPWKTRAHVYQSREEALLLSLERAQAVADELKQELSEARTRKIESDTLYSELNRTESDLEKARQREEQLKIESGFGTYAHIIKPGMMPNGPTRDPGKSMALMGGLAGAVLGLGVMLARTRLDHRCHEPGQLTQPPYRLTHQASIRAGSSELTAMDVHQTRISLVKDLETPQPSVTAIGSGCKDRSASDLATGLAISFAASGTDTLLIDLDSGPDNPTTLMSRRDHAALRKIGDLDPVPDDTIVYHAQNLGSTLGDMISELYHDLAPGDGAPIKRGVQAYMDGAPLKECVTPTSIPRLQMVRNEYRNPSDESAIPTHLIGDLLEDAKRHYPVVLVCINRADISLASRLACGHADRLLIDVHSGDSLREVRGWTHPPCTGHGARMGFVFTEAGQDQISQPLTIAVLETVSARDRRRGGADRSGALNGHGKPRHGRVGDQPGVDVPC